MKIISRKEAKRKGMKVYFTGKLCKRGHLAKRQVINANCIECHNIHSRRDYQKNLPQRRASNAERNRLYRQRNKDHINARLMEKRDKEAMEKSVWHENT